MFLLILLTGCPVQIEVDNNVAEIDEVRAPERLDEHRLAVEYTILDEEGDDQELTVEICLEGEAECGIPFQGNGSDGLTFVPTAPAGTLQLHRYVWDVGCGRVVGEDVIASDLSATYVARISVQGQPDSATTSEAFILSDLGFSESVECPAR